MFQKLARLVLEADSSQIKKAGKDLDQFEKRAAKVEKTASQLGKTIGRAAGAFATGLFVRSVIQNTIRQEQAIAQLDAALLSTGNAIGYTRDQLTSMAAELQKVSTFGDEAIIEAQARLVTYTGIVGTNFPRALQAVVDQSARLNTTITQSAELIGKALESPVKAAAALSDAGFGAAFTEEVKNTIESLVDQGKEAEAQIIILKILEDAYGGAAKAARDTLGGAISSLQNAFGDLLEGEGGSVTSTTDAINDLTDTLNSPEVKAGFQAIVNGILLTIEQLSKAIPLVVEFGRALGFITARAVGGSDDVFERLQDQIDETSARIKLIREELARPVMLRINPLRLNSSFEKELEELELRLEDLQGAQRRWTTLTNQATTPSVNSLGIGAAKTTVAITGLTDAQKKAAEEAEKLFRRIQGQIQGLQAQADTFGQSESAIKLYELRLAGATKAQLSQADAILQTIDNLERQQRQAEELGDAYGTALEKITGSIVDSDLSTRELNAAQRALFDLMTSPEWEKMPETWRQVAIEQTAAATAAIESAKLQNRINAAIASTPTMKLEETRKLMQGLADAYVKGRFGVVGSIEAINLFGETANTALGNTIEEVKELDEFAKNAAQSIQAAITDFLINPFQEGLDGMFKSFGLFIQRIIAEAVAADIARRLFGGLVEGGSGEGALGSILGGIGSFFGFKNTGGVVPAGSFAIAGERGPEIVRGPATVTSTRQTSQQSGGGGNVFNFNLPGITNRREAEMARGMLARTVLSAVRDAERYA